MRQRKLLSCRGRFIAACAEHLLTRGRRLWKGAVEIELSSASLRLEEAERVAVFQRDGERGSCWRGLRVESGGD